MVLSDDLDLRPIGTLAEVSGLQLTPLRRKKWLGEAQVVHRIGPR
jgi:hypothetical protein